MSKKILLAAIATISTVLAVPSWAHGPAEPKHGGIVQAASDLGFELAPTAEGVTPPSEADMNARHAHWH